MRLFEGTPLDRPPRCEGCGELEQACRCPPPAPSFRPSHEQTAKLAVEKRKHGRIVTVVRGLSAVDSDLEALLTRLKTGCGAGGTLRESVLEIQGDHRERVRDVLGQLGYRISG